MVLADRHYPARKAPGELELDTLNQQVEVSHVRHAGAGPFPLELLELRPDVGVAQQCLDRRVQVSQLAQQR